MKFYPMNMMHGFFVYARYQEEKDRGIAHDPEWEKYMAELEDTLRKVQDDVNIVGRVDLARSELPLPKKVSG